MGKRIFAALLLLTLLLPLGIPGSVQAAEEESLESIVQEQIEEYASSIMVENAGTSAKNILLRHAVFGGGKDLTEDEDSPITAALMNSDVLQECIIDGFTGLVCSIQDMQLPELYAEGYSAWYDSGCSYVLSSYVLDDDGSVSYVQSRYVDSLGKYESERFPLPNNVCDQELVYVVGTCQVYIQLKRTKVTESTVSYLAEVKVRDIFDFDGNINDEANGPLAGAMHGIAGDLAMALFKPYSWDCTTSFELTVPYHCDHRFANYQWARDAMNGQMVNVVGGDFADNATKRIHYSASAAEKYYFELENPILLRHDENWVIEYEGKGVAKFTLGNSMHNKSSEICFIHYESTECTEQNYESSGLFFGYWGDRLDENGKVKDQVYYRYGVQLDHIFEKNELYTYRCENMVAEDGSNMVYLSIYDRDSKQILSPTPMNGFFMTEGGWLKYQNQTIDWINGKDILINYIGNSTRTMFPENFCLRIWTRAKNAQDAAGYCWTLDEERMEMVSSCDNGYTENRAFLFDKNANGFYYALRKPVSLRHDKNWVLEYDARSNANFTLGNSTVNQTVGPYFRHENFSGLFLGSWKGAMDEEGNTIDAIYYRYGVKLGNILRSDQMYTFHYENIVAEDGSNMVYLSIYDLEGQQVLAPAPMNEFFTVEETENGNWTAIDQNQTVNWISGKDISISYIGNAGSYTFSDDFSLRIWPAGESSEEGNAIADGYIQPTCTMPGGKAQVCALCGYYELTEPTEPLGHSFGEYVSNEDADCVNDGTKTAECTICGAEDTVVDEGSVYGHEFRKYYSDNNATCTSDGTKTAECKYCEVTDTVPDPGTMLPHTYEAVITPPTCTEAGFTTYTCTCGDSYRAEETEATDHAWGEWEVTREPDYQAFGERTHSCIRCDATETEEINNNPFTDVGDGNRFKTQILWALYEGITSGKTETTFEPNAEVTRAQFVTFLWRAAGSPEPKSQENPFEDVTSGNRFLQAILWAYHEGITSGTTATSFSPNNTCTRGQVVMFLYRYAGSPEIQDMENPFGDVSTGNRFRDAILWAYSNGITTGKTETTFDIGGACTRAQVVTFLYRYLEEKKA